MEKRCCEAAWRSCGRCPRSGGSGSSRDFYRKVDGRIAALEQQLNNWNRSEKKTKAADGPKSCRMLNGFAKTPLRPIRGVRAEENLRMKAPRLPRRRMLEIN